MTSGDLWGPVSTGMQCLRKPNDCASGEVHNESNPHRHATDPVMRAGDWYDGYHGLDRTRMQHGVVLVI